jgi:orotate phosphoribosyltransferase
VEALREAGARVGTVVTVVDREEGASSMLREHTVDLVALARVSEILALRSA